MKNKLIYLIIGLITHFSFTNAAYSADACEPYTDSFLVSDMECVSDAYRYVSIGVGPIVFIPNVGIGYRERYSQFGYDTALSFSTIGYAHQLSAHLVGHYYLNPLQKNSGYVGLGLIGSGVLTNDKEGGFTLSPDFVFGKELERKDASRHFIEMHIAMPTFANSKHSNPHAIYLPLMYVKYGISF